MRHGATRHAHALHTDTLNSHASTDSNEGHKIHNSMLSNLNNLNFTAERSRKATRAPMHTCMPRCTTHQPKLAAESRVSRGLKSRVPAPRATSIARILSLLIAAVALRAALS